MNSVCFNGNIYAAVQPLFTAQNRGFRYGDGIFETIKVHHHKILLPGFHFDRLFLSLRLLKIDLSGKMSQEELSNQILELCRINNCLSSARVRLAVYRGEDNMANYVIEAFDLANGVNQLNEKGWSLDIYPYARKSVDAFANLKTANYLPFVLADLYAREKGLEECLVLNTENKICEASKANIFLVIDNEVHTPALHQGCVNGVMRRYVIEELKKLNIPVHQREVDENLPEKAEEVFLTNAINGMRWIKNFKGRNYQCKVIQKLYQQIMVPLLHE
jgi:branched-chain amino acid aminotransferase